MSNIKILYLYSELVGYQIPIFQHYVENYNAEVYVVSWDKKKLKPYTPPNILGVTYHKRSKYSKEELLELALKFNPDIIYISGWMDKSYLYVTKRFKKRGVPIVTAFDDIWVNSIRQKIGAFIFPFIFKKYFSHAWVAGPYQYEYAKRLGFKNQNIIFDMLSANSSLFLKQNRNVNNTNFDEEKAFLYVGNFLKIKGVDILIKAYELYRTKYKGKWKLICVGNGELRQSLIENQEIEVLPFSDEKKLIDISKRADVFILPSRHDQWGVVVHEFVSLGMPLLLAENIGSRATFFIDGFNGLLFRNNSPEDLAKKMYVFSQFETNKLSDMGKKSHLLSSRINIASSAANFISILDLDKN